MRIARDKRSASFYSTNRSWRTSARFFLGWLGILQVFQQLLGFCIVRRQLERFLELRPREIRLLLLEIDSRQHRSHYRGIARYQRSLQFLHRIIQLALAAVNFREPAVRGAAAGIIRKNSTKFLLRSIGVSRGEFLPTAPNARCRCVARSSGSSGSSGSSRARRKFNLRVKSRYVELG